MPTIPINEKPWYNSDQLANAIQSDDMWDCISEVVPGVGTVTRRRPALTSFTDLASANPGDGQFWWDACQKLVAVSGGKIYDVAPDGTATMLPATYTPLQIGVPAVFSAGTDHYQRPCLYVTNGGKPVYITNVTAADQTDMVNGYTYNQRLNTFTGNLYMDCQTLVADLNNLEISVSNDVYTTHTDGSATLRTQINTDMATVRTAINTILGYIGDVNNINALADFKYPGAIAYVNRMIDASNALVTAAEYIYSCANDAVSVDAANPTLIPTFKQVQIDHMLAYQCLTTAAVGARTDAASTFASYGTPVIGLTAITPDDKDTPNATHIDWIDSKFVANKPNSNEFLFTDVNDNVATATFYLQLQMPPNKLRITNPRSTRQILAGQPINEVIRSGGGVGPYTITLVSGSPGIGLSPGGAVTFAGGVVSGTNYTATVKVTDSTAPTPLSDTVTFTWTGVSSVNPIAIQSSAFSLYEGTNANHQLTASGGTGNLTWNIVGTVPAGVSITNFGELYINADASVMTSVLPVGLTPIYVSCSDSNGTTYATIDINVLKKPEVLPGVKMTIGNTPITGYGTLELAGAFIGQNYIAKLTISGEAVGSLTWTAEGLPDGLSISNQGVITGIPTFSPPSGAIADTWYGDTGGWYYPITVKVTDDVTSGQFDNTFWSGANNPVVCAVKGQNVNAIKVAWSQVYAWGSLAAQVFQDDGVTPFINVPGAMVEAGLEAPYSVCQAGNMIFAICVINGVRVVVEVTGSTPRIVSEPIARVLSEMPTVSDAIGTLISVGGLKLYALQFPTAAETWVYDYSNDSWFRWGSWNVSTGDHVNFLGRHAVFAKSWGKHLIMSRVDGKIYALDRNTYADAATPLVSFRRTGWIDHGSMFNRKRSVQLYIKVKTFAQDGVTNPALLMRWRDDGNPNWSSYMSLPLNPTMQGDCLIKLNRMGMYRTRQYEFQISDAVDLALISATETIQEERN